MDLTFELETGAKLKDEFLKLEGVSFLGGTTKFWQESEVQLYPLHFFTSWTLDPSINTLGPKRHIDQ